MFLIILSWKSGLTRDPTKKHTFDIEIAFVENRYQPPLTLKEIKKKAEKKTKA